MITIAVISYVKNFGIIRKISVLMIMIMVMSYTSKYEPMVLYLCKAGTQRYQQSVASQLYTNDRLISDRQHLSHEIPKFQKIKYIFFV